MDPNIEYVLKKVQTNTNLKVVLYVLCLFFYIISFHYLFVNSAAQYMAWILTFVVNAIFPFVWLVDYIRVGRILDSSQSPYQSIYLYSSICLFVTMIMQFAVLAFVISKNENVRKRNQSILERTDNVNKNAINKTFIQLNDKRLIHRDEIIKKSYVANTVLIWAMTSNIFAQFLKNQDVKNIPVGSAISWWISNIEFSAVFTDKLLHAYLDPIPLLPLVKCLIVYVITFVVILFGFFLRISHHPLSKSEKDTYRIVNIQSIFTREFKQSINQYQDLTMFFFSLLISLLTFVILAMIRISSKYIPIEFLADDKNANYYTILGCILAIVWFASFFGAKKQIFSNENKLKEVIFFILCVIFGIVGTPIAVASSEIILRMICGLSLGRGLTLGVVSVLLFLFLVFFLFGFGLKEGKMHILKSHVDKKGLIKTRDVEYKKENWIFHEDDLPFKTFLAILITMTISLFMGLSAHYDMFTFLYKIVAYPLKFVLMYLAPIAIFALAMVQCIFAYKNYQMTKYYTDG